MSRQIATLGGKLGASTVLGIDEGPTGQFAWGSSGAVNPQLMFQVTDNYVGEALSFIGIFSFWFYAPSLFNDVNAHLKFETSSGVHVFSEFGMENGIPRIRLLDDLKNVLVAVNANTTPTSDTWHHMLYSWNINTGRTYANDFHMLLDGVDVKPMTPATFLTGTPVEWGAGDQFSLNYRMGVVDSTTNAPTLRHAAWYLNYEAYLDFSVASNVLKFRDSDGNPAALGTDGSKPTGSQPLFYFDNPAASVIQNRGSAGTFVAGTTIIDAVGPNP